MQSISSVVLSGMTDPEYDEYVKLKEETTECRASHGKTGLMRSRIEAMQISLGSETCQPLGYGLHWTHRGRSG